MSVLLLSVGSNFFFFFKQKTAYEMRISDWSSDVCSSDLLLPGRTDAGRDAGAARNACAAGRRERRGRAEDGALRLGRRARPLPLPDRAGRRDVRQRSGRLIRPPLRPRFAPRPDSHQGERSEEHTSELQSLMRISYAVFCLKK